MERLKLAISRARDTASRGGPDQADAPAHGASPWSAGALPAEAESEPTFSGGQGRTDRRSWTLAALFLALGLGATVAFWAMKPAPAAAPPSAEAKVTIPPEQQAAVTAPAQPGLTAGAGDNTPANAEVPQAAATAAAAEPEKPQVPLEDQVEAAVEAWRQAWSTSDVTTYLEAYSEGFKPPAGETRSDWVTSRYRNVGGRKSIQVAIKELQVVPVGDDRARATFLQDYTSGNYREKSQPKTLDLIREASGKWRIVGEWQGDPPPLAETGKT